MRSTFISCTIFLDSLTAMMQTTCGPQTVTDGNTKALNLVVSVPSETEEETTCCPSSKESDTDSFIELSQVRMPSKTRGDEGELRHRHHTSHPVIDLTKQVKKRKKRKRSTVTQTDTSSSSEETQSSIHRWSPTVSEDEAAHSRPRASRCYFYVGLPSLQRAPAEIIHLHRLLGYMMSTPNESDIPDPTPSHRLARVEARQEITKTLSDFRWCINRYFDKRQ